ncbi:MAG: nucleoside-diphosphate kinase [Nanoarchaeota archaeon]|nr:nucleoside-diphosphate kinase [Nanoarchaeota archaeon]
MQEKTLILIKHDGVVRSLIGKILTRIENIGLKVIGMKMVWANEDLARNHYTLDEEWARKSFETTKKTHEREGKPFPHKNHMEFGSLIQSWNINFLREGPIIAIVAEGPHAIEIVRKIVGTTEPRQSPPGTIRGDFAMTESYELSDKNKRVLRNLIHASDSPKTAEREISLWFKPEELHDYQKELDKHF